MWRSRARRVLLVLSGVLAVSLVYLLVTRTDSGPRSINSGMLAQVDAGIDQFSFMQSKAGAVQWHVQAQRARMSEAEHQATLEDVLVTLYGQKGMGAQIVRRRRNDRYGSEEFHAGSWNGNDPCASSKRVYHLYEPSTLGGGTARGQYGRSGHDYRARHGDHRPRACREVGFRGV